ncbi:hypothetical protein ACFWBC_37790 [Streptomyces sp. NPDC059985]|uniref:hypothetical protein n=1 Tax=Streptomyces sp. NPDC059985 TaxID=3347025 RepID=UPI00367769BF
MRDTFHGEWNYVITPRDPNAPNAPTRPPAPDIPPETTHLLTHPALTGMTREQFDRLVHRLEPCRDLLAEANRQAEGRDRRGRNPGFGVLDHRHRVLAALLSSRNTVTITLVAQLLGRPQTTVAYHALASRPLLAFGGTEMTTILARRRTHPPRSVEALKEAIERHDLTIKAGDS